MLSRLSDQELILGLQQKVRVERSTVVELLQYLEEVENRELHLARGFPSLFAFCVEFLGYSEGEAHVRIQAMRLIRAVPVAREQISSGKLSMTVAAKAQNCFRRASKMKQKVALSKKVEVVESLLSLSTRDAERKLVSVFPEAGLPQEFAKPISQEMTRIEFNANRQQLAKFERLKGLLAHKNYEGRWDKLFEELADIALAKLAKRHGGEKTVHRLVEDPESGEVNGHTIGVAVDLDAALLEAPQVKLCQKLGSESDINSRANFGKNMKAVRSRHIPDSIRKFVWVRDRGRCQYQDHITRKRCESQHAVQCDHIIPFAQGGEHISTNLRLMCAVHNRWRSTHTRDEFS